MKRHVLLVCLPDRSDAWDELKVCRHPKLSCTFTCKGTQCCCSPDCRPLQASHRLQRSGVRCSWGYPPGGETQCVAPCLMLSAVGQSHSGTLQQRRRKKYSKDAPHWWQVARRPTFFFFLSRAVLGGVLPTGGSQVWATGRQVQAQGRGGTNESSLIADIPRSSDLCAAVTLFSTQPPSREKSLFSSFSLVYLQRLLLQTRLHPSLPFHSSVFVAFLPRIHHVCKSAPLDTLSAPTSDSPSTIELLHREQERWQQGRE